MDEAWISGKPWSSYTHAKKHGRYAPAIISANYKVHPKIAEQMVEAWLMNDVLSVEIRDKNSKLQGLKVIGSI